VSWPLTCNVLSMAPRRREAFWRLITERLSATPPISQRQAGTRATLTWSRYCRSEHMTQFRHPTGASVPHHVVIYLGGDQILQAPETGQNVGYGTLSEFPGQTATVRRITEP
jgi:hypothetical protein